MEKLLIGFVIGALIGEAIWWACTYTRGLHGIDRLQVILETAFIFIVVVVLPSLAVYGLIRGL